MNDNYLWDKSGEPDEEIQQLESLLSEFQAEPRPLIFPVETKKQGFFTLPFLALFRYVGAGAVTALVLLAGFWAVQRMKQPSDPVVAVLATPSVAPVASPQAAATSSVVTEVYEPGPQQTPSAMRAVGFKAATHTRHAKVAYKRTSRAEQEAAAGALAKEKVMLALQITSTKLNFVSKKIHADMN